MTSPAYKMCTRCIMDTTDTDIKFDTQGVCNHCHEFENVTTKRWFPNEKGAQKLQNLIKEIKQSGEGAEYDCIMGLSGGVDSSYLALLVKDYGLRPLVVHVDAGWNSELAVYNIEKIIKYCGYDLHTIVMDWDEMRDLQLSYLKAGVANQDVVQDHAFFSSLYHFAVKSKIKYVISGGNVATEAISPPKSWQHSKMDAISLHAIHKKFGKIKLKTYRTISFLEYYLYYPFIYKMKTVNPLDFVDYNKAEALKFLKEKVGYKEYSRKHGESVFTKFFQNYYLPKKFNFDKRKPHLSSLIVSGQMTRAEALEELEKPLYDPRELKEDLAYIAKKLQITSDELTALIESPGHHYTEFKNWDQTYKMLKKTQGFAEKVLGRRVSNYS